MFLMSHTRNGLICFFMDVVVGLFLQNLYMFGVNRGEEWPLTSIYLHESGPRHSSKTRSVEKLGQKDIEPKKGDVCCLLVDP